MTTLTQPTRKVKMNGKAESTVSLVLAIDHQCYGVTPLRDIKDLDVVKGFRLEKKSDGTVYDVCQTTRGLQCDCPDWQARHFEFNSAGCKHVRACVHLGLLEAPARVPAPAATNNVISQTVPPADSPDPAPTPTDAPGPVASGPGAPAERGDAWEPTAEPNVSVEEPAMTPKWSKPEHATFAADLEAAGYDVREYQGRGFYTGPAVSTDCNSSSEVTRALQDIIRATSVYVRWDDLGHDLIVYPER